MNHEKGWVEVFAPATVANVSCGFDIFGFALDEPGDRVRVSLSSLPGIRILSIRGDNGRLPLDPEKNTAGAAVGAMIRGLGTLDSHFQNLFSETGVELIIHKGMPLGSGLGSSAASACAALFGLNSLLGQPLTPDQLIPFAMVSEQVACGAAHADNVAPCLMGGFTLIRSTEPLDVIRIPVPENLGCVVVHPKIEINTRNARAVLPAQVSLKKAVEQSANASSLIAALFSNDLELLSRSLVDVLAEPARAALIPGFSHVRRAALESGALGCGISGSGPSIFALTDSGEKCASLGKAMKEVFDRAGIEARVYVSGINSKGPKFI